MSTVPNYPALVLNASYEPLRVFPLLTWDFGRVFRHAAAGKVTVVEEYDAELRSANMTWRPPSVVALKRYVQTPEKVPFSRINILIRDEHKCQYCGKRLTLDDLTFDHVKPRSQGGPTNFNNIVSACVPCNKKKANKTNIKPIREPRVPTGREMAALRPIRKSSIPSNWANYLEWSGIITVDDIADRHEDQKMVDQGYWEWPLES